MHLRRRRNVSSDFGNLTWMVAASTLTGLRSSGGILSTTLSLESVPIGCRNIPYPGLEGFLFSARGHVSKQVKVFEAGDSALISSSSGAWMTTHRESPPHAEFYLRCQAPRLKVLHIGVYSRTLTESSKAFVMLCASIVHSRILISFLCPLPMLQK